MGIDAPQRVDVNVMDELTTDAIDWLERQSDDVPFLLYFTPVAIHFPYTPSGATKDTSGIGLYGDWIHELDLSIGRILDALDRMEATEDTLVIFTSDNGGVLMTEGDRPEAEAYRAGLRCNGNWRGRKHSIYEGGFRVPFIVRWPGHVQASTVCDETISLVDMYATIAALINRPVSDDEDVAEDSFNVLPSFLGEATQEPIRSSIILHSPNGNFAIRQGPWKYIEGKPSPTLKKISRKDELVAQLYNLQDDHGEQNNLLSEHPDIAERLTDLLEEQPDWPAQVAAMLASEDTGNREAAVELLRQIDAGSETDPAVRIAALERPRDQIDAEIARVRDGDLPLLDDTALKERFQQFIELSRALLSDFREVEQNFRTLDRWVRERITLWQGSKGELLEAIMGERDAITDSDQGRSFRGFWDFLMSSAWQAEFSDLLERIL